jgi:hypothetical protein
MSSAYQRARTKSASELFWLKGPKEKTFSKNQLLSPHNARPIRIWNEIAEFFKVKPVAGPASVAGFLSSGHLIAVSGFYLRQRI